MNLLKKYWRSIAIGILLILVGILLTFNCRRSDTTSSQQTIDDLKLENKALQQSLSSYNDSVTKLVKARDDTTKILNKELEAITRKYIAIRKSHPTHDTIVKDSIVYRGNECCEKLPVVERQRDNCLSEVVTLKAQVIKIDEGNKALQKQFEAVVATSEEQTAMMKKLDRKRKWNKIWAVGATVSTIGVLTAILVTQ